MYTPKGPWASTCVWRGAGCALCAPMRQTPMQPRSYPLLCVCLPQAVSAAVSHPNAVVDVALPHNSAYR